MTNSISCIYVWRLDPEKWVDLILDAMSSLLNEWVAITLDLYGSGVLESQVLAYATKYKQITYHGFKPKDEILTAWKLMDFCLIPSLFLETFGLTALDSLWVWVPIIAPRKWWLSQFVSEELVLDTWTVDELKKTLLRATLIKHSITKYASLVDQAVKIYSSFSYSSRYHQVQDLWITKEILLINDYGANHGWIETLLKEMKTQLERSGHIIHTLSATQKRLTQSQRYVWLIKTLANLSVTKRIQQYGNPKQLFWRHSVHRQLWWLPIAWSSKNNIHRIMIHDMGLLHPFPSNVYSESQIEKAETLLWRIREWISVRSIVWLPFIVAKWISIQMIWKQIEKKHMLIQVPSEYLIPHVSKRVKQCHVVCIPHFVLPYQDAWNL